MRATHLTDRGDIQWLLDTHLKPFALDRDEISAATLGGNEDCPEWIEVFFHDRAAVTYQLQPDLTYREET